MRKFSLGLCPPALLLVAVPLASQTVRPVAPADSATHSATTADRQVTSTRFGGRVVDRETGRPIAGVGVQLLGEPIRATTDRAGEFVLEEVRPGPHTLSLTHPRFGERRSEVKVAANAGRVELRISTRAVELAEIEVRVAPERADRAQSRRSGWRSSLLTREEVEARGRNARHLGDVLRMIPGLRVRETPFNSRIGQGLCVETSRKITGRCEMVMLVLDDIPMGDPGMLFRSMAVNQIESIEYMRGGEAGARYGTGSANGVVRIYTRGNGPTAPKCEGSDRSP